MAKFATETDVPVEKSRAEIEGVLARYGATEFASGWMVGKAMIGFVVNDRRVRFVLPLPDRKAREYTHYRHSSGSSWIERSPEAAAKQWEQACRQRWRALLLAIKAKLEAVECGIASFEEEFMAHIVLPNGLTIGEHVLPQLPAAFETGNLPPLLPAAS